MTGKQASFLWIHLFNNIDLSSSNTFSRLIYKPKRSNFNSDLSDLLEIQFEAELYFPLK